MLRINKLTADVLSAGSRETHSALLSACGVCFVLFKHGCNRNRGTNLQQVVPLTYSRQSPMLLHAP